MDAYTGEIRAFGFSYVPENWLLCDGTQYAIPQYQQLFAIIANLYGGDGRTTFKVPDVLSVGIAVDANVLIFERIREELRHGKTPRASVDTGYARATLTILDSNVTTLIAGVALIDPSIITGQKQLYMDIDVDHAESLMAAIDLLTSQLVIRCNQLGYIKDLGERN